MRSLTLLPLPDENFLPGRGCGTVTPIGTIDSVPEDYEEASKLGCVFVRDKTSLDRHKAKMPSETTVTQCDNRES